MARDQSKHEDFDKNAQYHSKTHQVNLKNGTTLYGLISRVDYKNREFYLLESDQPGMLGSQTAGKKFSWDECRSVKAENQRIGSFDDNMIPEWERWDRSAALFKE